MDYNRLDEWEKYEKGIKYNNSLKPNYYDTVNTNIAFASGDQWRNVESNGQPTPTFNFIKKTIAVVVSFLTSSKVKIKLSPLAYNEDTQDETQQSQQHASEIATSEIENLFEKFKLENKIRDGCFDSAIMGDVYAHMLFNTDSKPYNGMLGEYEGEIEFELLDGVNVFLGNPNNPTISTKTQPYIQVTGRDMVETLKWEAQQYKKKGGESDKVTDDKLTQYQAGDMARMEIEGDQNGKALFVITYKYDRKTKTIKSTKCTESAYMWKDVDTGMSVYPVAGFPWEKQKNQYHGRALSTGMIPNQIFINKMFAMVMYHLMMSAFPKIVYDKNKVSSWDNTISGAIPVDLTMPGDSVRNAAAYMEPGNMSSQITQVIDMAIKYTKETLGINDTLTGDVNPEQASGAAIATSVKQSSITFENPKANMYEWIEDIGKILVDMMGTYYGERPIVVTKDNQKVIETFNFDELKNLWFRVKCDVGPSTYWSEIAQVQMLNNLLSLRDPAFGLIEYLETLPSEYRTQELIDIVKAKQKQLQDIQAQQQTAMQEQAQQAQAQQQQGQEQQMQQDQQAKEQQYEQMAQWLEKQTPELQKKVMSLPTEEAQMQAIDKLMHEDIKQTMQGQAIGT